MCIVMFILFHFGICDNTAQLGTQSAKLNLLQISFSKEESKVQIAAIGI